MASEIFENRLKEIDDRMKKGRKIAIIVDNCPAHPKLERLPDFELVFLPPNTTSKTQPMDNTVMNNLKVHYLKRKVLRQIHATERNQYLVLTVLDGLCYLRQAWD